MSKNRILLFGSKIKNRCQELNLYLALQNIGVDVEIVNPFSLSSNLHQLPERDEGVFTLIRSFFYKYMKDGYNPENEHKIIKLLRKLERKTMFLNSIDGLIVARDKLTIDAVLRELEIPHIPAYELKNHPDYLITWIDETADRFENGIIIKDRFGGMGKGILRVKKQGNVYLCDMSCIDGLDQEYVNIILNKGQLRNLFERYMARYILIGQPYIKSEHEFRTETESESIRILDIGQQAYVAMKRIAESPINNLALTKNHVVNGSAQKTDATSQEIEFSRILSQYLGLFLAGHDFIRTSIEYYPTETGALWIPENMRKKGDISVLLEPNGNVQYCGIQELYKNQYNISSIIAAQIQIILRNNTK
ncbi:MAG: hypothetical protein ABIG89_01645 [Candidatus Woesearchaeota archaeon]